MKRVRKVLKTISCIMAIVMSSCVSKIDKGFDIAYIPGYKGDVGGFIDKEGVFIPMPSANQNISAVVNGYFMIDDKIYKFGDCIQDTSNCIASEIIQAGIMNNGLMPVCKEFDKISVINEDGSLAFVLSEFCGEYVVSCFSYSDSKMRVLLNDGSYIFIDKEGNMLFDTKYSWATDFKNGYAIVQNERQNEYLFSLIDCTGIPIFTFESSKEDGINISYDLELLCGIEDENVVIYDFKGKRVLECPSKVEKIINFLEEGFIFSNEEGEFGFMSYSGEVMIKAKYEQLVHNGLMFLALMDEEVDLIDSKDNVIKRFDGVEIYDYHEYGFNFPNVIIDEDGYLTIIDESGDVIADELEYDMDFYSIINAKYVESLYLPKEDIIDSIIELLDNGKGLSNKYGAFFDYSEHCHTRDILFLNKITISYLTGKYDVSEYIDSGINYKVSYRVVFDEPIVRNEATELNTSAWLTRVEILVDLDYRTNCKSICDSIIQKLEKSGCRVRHYDGRNNILSSADGRCLYALAVKKSDWASRSLGFRLVIMPNNDRSINYMRFIMN